MLDLGCGTGQMLLRYASRFRRADRRRSQSRNARHRASRVPRRGGRPLHARAFRFLPVPRDGSRPPLARHLRGLPPPPAGRSVRRFLPAGARVGSAPNGQLLLAEPVDTQGRRSARRRREMEREVGDGGTSSADADGGKPRGADRRRRVAAAAGSASAFAAWSPRAPGRCSSARCPPTRSITWRCATCTPATGARATSSRRCGRRPERRRAHRAASTQRSRSPPRSPCPRPSVVALPPMSGVRGADGSASTRSIAPTTAFAASAWPRCSSISAPDQIWPIGLAMPLPAMSGAEPCTGSKSDGCSRSGLMLPDGAMPIVPQTAGPRSDRMSPKRLDPTTTSKRSGRSTKCATRMSMWNWSVRMPG